MTEPTSTTSLTCYVHPDRETSLRCNRCDRPICPSCAMRTPTGYRCKECVRGQQKVFETSTTLDFPVAFVISGILAFLGSLIASVMGFFILILAPIIGVVIAEVVRFAIRKRRSRGVFITAAVGTVIGSLISLLPMLGLLILGFAGGSRDAISIFSGLGFNLLWQGLYTVLVTSSMYYRLSGIQLRM